MAPSDKGVRPPVVLVATDHEWATRSLESILAPNGFAVIRASSGRQAQDFAMNAQPDAIILDARLGDMSGAHLCRMLRSDPRVGPQTPIIITAAESGNRTLRNEALEAGAWSYCSQPVDGEALLLQLRTFIEAKRSSELSREESLLDDLTGLYSLRGLARRAREIGAEAQRRHMPLACLAFAPVSDSSVEMGVSAFADLARHVGAVCQSCSRASDAVGRLGQAEFAVIAPATDADGAMRLLERLSTAVGTSQPATERVPRGLRIRAGFDAIHDFADSRVDAVEMLLRATTALRYTRGLDIGATFTSFDQLPPTYHH